MKAWNVLISYSLRVTEEDVTDSIELEEGQPITAKEAERVAMMWMAEPENCNEEVTTTEAPEGA